MDRDRAPTVPEGESAAARPLGAWAVVALTTALQIGASFAQQGLAVVAFWLRTEDHLGLVGIGALVTAQTLGMAVGMIPAGRLVDRSGAAPSVALGAGGVVASLVAVDRLVPGSAVALGAALFALGAFTSLLPLAGARLVVAAVPAPRRGLAMGARQSGVTIGAGLAAALLPGLTAASGLALAVPLMVALLGAPAAALAALRRRLPVEAGSVAPATGGRIRWRALAAPALVGGLLSAGQYDALAYLITDLSLRSGVTAAAGGAYLAVVQAVATVGRVGAGALSDRLRIARRRAVAGLATFGVGALAALAVTTDASPVAIALLAAALGLGGVSWNSLVLTWAAEAVPAADRGTAMGVAGAAIFAGAALFPPLFGAVAAGPGFGAAWLMVAVQYAVAAAVAALASPAGRARASAP